MKTLVIIPTYNEKDNIEELVSKILKLNPNLDLLIIDDNSPDGTGEIIDKLKIRNEKLNVVHREKKLGLGSAYKQGFKRALEKGYDVVFTMDADFSHNPEYLPKILRLLNSNDYDLVIGSRYVRGGGTIGWPIKRKIISRCGNLYAKIVAGLPTNDNTSGFMCIKKNVLETIGTDDMQTEGYGFLIELKHRTFRKNFRIFEEPIVFVDRIVGKSKISKSIIFEAMLLVWKLRFSKA